MLNKKFENEFNSMKHEKQKQIDEIEKKFANKKSDLELQQKDEIYNNEKNLIKKRNIKNNFSLIHQQNSNNFNSSNNRNYNIDEFLGSFKNDVVKTNIVINNKKSEKNNENKIQFNENNENEEEENNENDDMPSVAFNIKW